MKTSGITLLTLSLSILLLSSLRTSAVPEGTPFTSYEEFIGLVESNRIVAVQYSSNNHTLAAQQVADQATNELTCIAPWFGGSIDPLLQRLLQAHHVAILLEPPHDDRWEIMATTGGWLLVPILTLILLIVMFVRQTKIIKKLDA